MDDASRSTDLARVADHLAVSRLQVAYADGVTRRDWQFVRGLFRPEAVVALDLVTRPPLAMHGPQAVTDFISAAVEHFDFFEFVILNSLIELWPDGDLCAATARIFMCELRHAPGEGRSEAFGRYEDRYAKDAEGTWRIADRRYRSMARFPSGEVFPLD